MEIYKDFTFEAAHRLPHVLEGQECARLHGYSFPVRGSVADDVGGDAGWVCDYSDLKAAFRPVFDKLDHHYLSDVPGFENPTSVILAQWVWVRMKAVLPILKRFEVKETCTSGCIYIGDGVGHD